MRLDSWWHHQMETFSALLAFWVGNSLVNYPHKGQLCRALIFSLICAWTNVWVNNRDAGDLRRHRAHYDVTVMYTVFLREWNHSKLHHAICYISMCLIPLLGFPNYLSGTALKHCGLFLDDLNKPHIAKFFWGWIYQLIKLWMDLPITMWAGVSHLHG